MTGATVLALWADDPPAMKKIGMLTIGQSPRNDILPSMKEILGDGFEIVEIGALDDLTLKDIKMIDVRPDDYVLVSRMRDGTEIKITKRFVLPLLQEKLVELEDQGVRLTVVMCTGKFPQFETRGIVFTPQETLKGVVKSALKKGRLGVIYPTEEQMPHAQQEFGSEDVAVYADSISPYDSDVKLQGLASRLKDQNLDFIVLNCFGFGAELKKFLDEQMGKPVIQSNTFIARVLRELSS